MKHIPECYLTHYPYGQYLNLSNVDTTKFKINKQTKTLTYNDITVAIDTIQSNEIRIYCIKQIVECFLTHYPYGQYLNLSDCDTTQFKIDKQNQTLTYNDTTVNIKDIKSDEIKKYCINELQSSDDKDICKYIIDTIIYYNNRITINTDLFNSLKSPQNKLHILKYVFSKYDKLTELTNREYVFKIFLEYPSFLIDLLRQMISTNNKNLEYILKNKVISIDRHEYKKLLDYACSLHLFEFTNILTIYESLDYTINDKVEIKDKDNSLKDELWN
jgi:hypothetical protein